MPESSRGHVRPTTRRLSGRRAGDNRAGAISARNDRQHTKPGGRPRVRRLRLLARRGHPYCAVAVAGRGIPAATADAAGREDEEGEPRAYELGQLVATLSAVSRTMTHCGFGPENPMPPLPLGYGPPVYLCDSSSTSTPSGSSSMDAVPCTWTLSYGLAASKITTAARGSRFKLATLRRLLGIANQRSSPSRFTQTTVEWGLPSGSSVDSTAKFLPSNSSRALSLSRAIGFSFPGHQKRVTTGS